MPESISDQINYIHFINETSLEIKPASDPILRNSVKEELVKSIALLEKVKRCSLVSRSRNDDVRKEQLEAIESTLQLTITSLQQNPHALLLARRLRRDAEFVIRGFTNPFIGSFINGLHYIVYKSDTPVKVLIGLFLALPIYMAIPLLPYQSFVVQPLIEPILIEENQTTENHNLPAHTSQISNQRRISQYDVDRTIALLVLVGIAGALGSIVSMLTRIKEYENEKYSDAILPVLIGAFKPLIGGAFGIFLFAMINSGFLPLKVKDDVGPINEWYALFAVAFVAGFSERLVKDIISQAEKKVIGASETTPTVSQTEKKVIAASESTLETTPTVSQTEKKVVAASESTLETTPG